MKKILLTMAMILMMASPAMAGTPTIINGVGRNLDTVNVDNHLYLPLRTIAEVLGLDVQWDGTFVRVDSNKRPVITGDDKFKGMVTQALDLLQEKSPPDYEMVCKQIEEISLIESFPTKYGVNAYAGNNGNRIFITNYLTKSDKYNSIYVAGALAHEATHSCNAKSGIVIGSSQDENIAYLREISTLRIIGAYQQDIDSTERTRLQVINFN